MNAISEEEQVETLKRWWSENGVSLLTGIVLALVAVYGWQGWQRYQAGERAESSVAYQSLMDAYVAATEPGADEAKTATFEHLAAELRDNYPKSAYAGFGALQNARFHAQKGDLDAAAEALQWVLDTQPKGPVAELARIRLARLMLDRGDGAGALALISAAGSDLFAVAYLELKGDVLHSMERFDEAGAAYREAMELAEQRGERRPLLEMKMYDLGPAREEA